MAGAGRRGAQAWEPLLRQLAPLRARDERQTEGKKREGETETETDGRENRERKLERETERAREGWREGEQRHTGGCCRFVTWSQCQTPSCPPYSVGEKDVQLTLSGTRLSLPPERKTIKGFVDLL